RTPTTAGGNISTPPGWMKAAASANSRPRSNASSSWSPSSFWTRRCSRTWQKKVVTPNQQRAAADYLSQEYAISQRRASEVLGCARSTLRYTPKERSDDTPLIRAIRRLAQQHLRWGYRLIHARLEHQGWTVNLKRVHRLWRELGLRRQVRRRRQ